MYYIYCHIDPETCKIFYIGKGTKNRSRSLQGRSNIHKNKLAKLQKCGWTMQDIARILYENIESEQVAYNLEKEYIKQYGLRSEGGVLLNLQQGGQGASSGQYNNNYRHDLEEEAFIMLLREGYDITDISNKLKVNKYTFKRRFYPDKTLRQYCDSHSIVKYNHMTRLDITEELFVKYLKEQRTNKEIGKLLKINVNTLKSKFYPNTTLKEYCNSYGIDYVNTQRANKNSNYKEFDKDKFIHLVTRGCNLQEIEIALQLSKRCIIEKYRNTFNVKNWRELKEVLSNFRLLD
jgi:hypothetical protein